MDTLVPVVFADLSRVQHSDANVNVALRLMIDSTEVAQTNSGNAQDWAFGAVTLHGVSASLAPGTHTAEANEIVASVARSRACVHAYVL